MDRENCLLSDCLLALKLSALSQIEKLKLEVQLRRASMAVAARKRRRDGGDSETRDRSLSAICNDIISLCNKHGEDSDVKKLMALLTKMMDDPAQKKR